MTPRRQEPPHRGARYFRLPRRRRPWLAVVGWSLWGLVGLVVAILAGGYIYLDSTLQSAAPDTPEARAARAATRPVLPGRPINVLLIGSDTRPSLNDPGRSDSLILVRMDNQRGFISMLSFPRDLYVDIPGVGRNKINAAYSHGTAKSIETVQQLTGEPINYYVVIDFHGFARLVDEEGGVYLDIDRRYYNKNIGTAATNYADIDLQPGYQKLTGAQALAYVRYRHTDSDYSRIARQQQFLSELKRQTKDIGQLVNITSFKRIFGENVETNISNPQRFLGLLEAALTTPDDRIARVAIQGSTVAVNGASVEEASPQEIAAKVAAWKNPEFEQGSTSEKKPLDPSAVGVAVLNGSGRVLAGEEMAGLLASRRYRATVGGNADSFGYPSSAVYYAPGFRPTAQVVAALIGPSTDVAPLDPAKAGGNQVVVVVGRDFSGRLAARPPKAQARPPASTVDTTSLVPELRRAQRELGMKVMVPLKMAAGSRVKIVRAYRVNAGGKPPAVKIVVAITAGGMPRYWGITMTTAKGISILEGQTGSYTTGGREYLTYYDGRALQRLAFRKDGVTYWISNTLANDLSAKTIEEIAKSMRPLNRARLPMGRTDTPISVETAGSTP